MTRTISTWKILAVLGVAALAITFVTLAQPPGGGPMMGHHGGGGRMGHHGGGPGEGGPGGMHGGPEHFLLHGLDLTDAQRDQIEALYEAQHDTLETQHEAVHKAVSDLTKLALSDQYSEAAAASLAASVNTAVTEIAETRAGTLHSVYQLLTAEQRQELAGNLQRIESHLGHHRGMWGG